MTLQLAAPPISIEFDIADLADWVELSALASRRPFLTGTLQPALVRENDPYASARAQQVWAEVERRARLSPRGGALRVGPVRVTPLTSHPNYLLHFFLGSLSIGVEVSNEGRRLFEECVTDIVVGLTGSQALRLGSPRSKGMPASLDEAVGLYLKLAREIKHASLPATDKDLALDVVTWQGFSDRRGGYLNFIGQCATGRSWFEDDKHKDLTVAAWLDYVVWAVDPVRFFAVPSIVPPHRWRRACREAGLILDRARLLELAMGVPVTRRRLGRVYEYCRSLYQPPPT